MRLRISRIPRIPHLRTVAEIVGALVLLSGGAASAAVFMPAATSTTIHACENTRTGALSVRVHATCSAGTKAISWDTTGPAGPPGTTGIFGKGTNTAKTSASGGATCTVGEVILTAGNTANSSTIPANGQLLKISSNQVLFALLGTKYGGNGTTTFALPNLQKAAPNGLSYSICQFGDYP